MRLLLAYDELEMGLEGKRLCDLVGQAVGDEKPPALSVWKLALLSAQGLRQKVTALAERADLVVVVVQSYQRCASLVDAWVKEWTDQRNQRPGALVLLENQPGQLRSADSPAHAYMRQLVEGAGMDFFHAAMHLAVPEETAAGTALLRLQSAWPAATSFSPTVVVNANPLYTRRHWGLNE